MSERIQLEEGPESMKPMLGMLVQEAVVLALIDVAEVPLEPEGERPSGYTPLSDHTRAPTEAERLAWRQDIHQMPEEALARFDPMALAQNVGCRLLGTGGWSVNGVYSGNASVREVMEASFERPDRHYVDEVAFDLGFTPADDDDEDVPRG